MMNRRRLLQTGIVVITALLMLCTVSAAAAENNALVTLTAYDVLVSTDNTVSVAGYFLNGEVGKTAVVVLSGDVVTITVNPLPSGYTLKPEYSGTAEYTRDGNTITVKNVRSNVMVTLKAEKPYIPPSPSGGGGGSPSVIIPPTVNPTTPVPTPTPTPVPVTPDIQKDPDVEVIIDVGVESQDGKYTAEDVTQKYSTVPIIDSVMGTVHALDLINTGSVEIFATELMAQHPYLTAGEKQLIADTFTRAVKAGVITKTANNAPLLLSGTAVTEGNVKFYCVYDIKAEAGSDAVNRIDFAVPLADIASAEMTVRDIIMYHCFPDYNVWMPLDTYLAGIDETHAYYSAYTQSASPFAVVFMKDMTIVPGESFGQKYLWLILIIAAVLIIGIITGVCIRQHRKKIAVFSEIK